MSDNDEPLTNGEKKQAALQAKNSCGERCLMGRVLVLLVVIGMVSGFWLWYKSKAELVTDDAFVSGHVHVISARVGGYVNRVCIDDNQLVAKGDLLVELDPAPYLARLHKSEAALALAKNGADAQRAAIAAAQAVVEQSRSRARQAQADLRRAEKLFASEVIARERLEQVQTAADVARHALAQARQNMERAVAQLGENGSGGQIARIAEKTAEVKTARLNLDYTRITAAVPGYVTRRSVEVGSNVQPGQALLALVQLDDTWIVANYKESQLTHVRPGQRVEFRVDAYPQQLFTGRVDSIMAGTGAAFSLLPPENATGNYVKVVQRIPVKIVIDPVSDPQHVLRVGMSVEPKIYTGLSMDEVLAALNPFD